MGPLGRKQVNFVGLRHLADPKDVVQSVYKSFFFRLGDGNLDVAYWNRLWDLLALINVRKRAAERRDTTRG
jgi:hypothetical protein